MIVVASPALDSPAGIASMRQKPVRIEAPLTKRAAEGFDELIVRKPIEGARSRSLRHAR